MGVVIWVMCGTYAIVREDDGGFVAALTASVLLGLGYIITHNH